MAVEHEISSEIQGSPMVVPRLAPGLTPDIARNLPPWGKVLVLCSAFLGFGSAAGLSRAAKSVGIQTTEQAATDNSVLKKEIEAAVAKEQASEDVEERNHAAMLAEIQKLKDDIADLKAQGSTRQRRRPPPKEPTE